MSALVVSVELHTWLNVYVLAMAISIVTDWAQTKQANMLLAVDAGFGPKSGHHFC